MFRLLQSFSASQLHNSHLSWKWLMHEFLHDCEQPSPPLKEWKWNSLNVVSFPPMYHHQTVSHELGTECERCIRLSCLKKSKYFKSKPVFKGLLYSHHTIWSWTNVPQSVEFSNSFLQFVVVCHFSVCLRYFMVSTSWHTESIYSIKHHVYHVHLISCGLIHGRFKCLTYIFCKNNCFLPSCYISIRSTLVGVYPSLCHHASDTMQLLILFLFSARWCDSEYSLHQSDQVGFSAFQELFGLSVSPIVFW